ncbi:hypothetical protein AGMMS49991_11330 [Spirochaetia bacterium]|nr:hypothetical protein AGMMS49991_11330 [Spirochaetia bacterium]
MSRWEVFALRRQEWCGRHFSAVSLCAASLVMMPALLFNPDTVSRCFQFLFFWFLAWLMGKKNNPLITILVIFGIVFFNLLVPYGEVLFSLGGFRITAGALRAGIHRGVTLEALVMLSRGGVRQDLRLPGAFGELVGESFRVFAQLTERKHIINRSSGRSFSGSKKSVRWKNVIAVLDDLLIELSESGDKDGTAGTVDAVVENQQKNLADWLPGIIILAAAVILAWVPMILQFLWKGQSS